MDKKTKILRYLEVVVQILPAPIYWEDLNGIIMGGNNAVLKAVGIPDIKEYIGKTPYDLYPAEIAEVLMTHSKMVIKTGKQVEFEESIKDFSTGKLKYFNAIKAPIYDDQHTIIGVIGTAIEITDKKEAENLRIQNAKHHAELNAQKIFKECIDNIQNMLQEAKIKLINNKIGIQLPTEPQNHDITLTKREQEVLYFLSMGKSPKEIANIFSKLENKKIASATIGGVINKQLYPKFDVFNTGQLIEKASLLKLIPFLHESILGFSATQ